MNNTIYTFSEREDFRYIQHWLQMVEKGRIVEQTTVQNQLMQSQRVIKLTNENVNYWSNQNKQRKTNIHTSLSSPVLSVQCIWVGLFNSCRKQLQLRQYVNVASAYRDFAWKIINIPSAMLSKFCHLNCCLVRWFTVCPTTWERSPEHYFIRTQYRMQVHLDIFFWMAYKQKNKLSGPKYVLFPLVQLTHIMGLSKLFCSFWIKKKQTNKQAPTHAHRVCAHTLCTHTHEY